MGVYSVLGNHVIVHTVHTFSLVCYTVEFWRSVGKKRGGGTKKVLQWPESAKIGSKSAKKLRVCPPKFSKILQKKAKIGKATGKAAGNR